MRYLTFLIFAVAFIVVAACARPSQTTDNSTVAAAATPTPTPTPAPNGSVSAPTPDEAPRITVEEAKKAFDDGKAFIIDARAAEAYKAEHIKGAVNIRHDNLDASLKDLPKDKTIIVYCS